VTNIVPRIQAEIVPTGSLPADQNPMLVYLSRLGPKSRKVQRQALETLAAILVPGLAVLSPSTVEALPWHLLRYQHTQAIRAKLVERYAPATSRRLLSALGCVLDEAMRLGLMTAEELVRARGWAPVRGSREPPGRALSTAEITILLEAMDASTAAGARDQALLAVAYSCGLRRAELVAIDLGDIRGKTLLVHGKGNKQRTMQLGDEATRIVTHWIKVYRGNKPGPLLRPVDRFGRVGDRRLSETSVRFLVQKLATQAHVAGFSPHDLRRTFVSLLLDRGHDLSSVQKLAGHANPNTTARYDRRAIDVAGKRAAAELGEALARNGSTLEDVETKAERGSAASKPTEG
jgi:site-specific recombinase XerD